MSEIRTNATLEIVERGIRVIQFRSLLESPLLIVSSSFKRTFKRSEHYEYFPTSAPDRPNVTRVLLRTYVPLHDTANSLWN